MHNYTGVKYTERLLIRPLELDDVEIWTHYLTDPRTTEFYPDLMKKDIGNWANKSIKKA